MTCPSSLLREARQGQAAEPALPGLARAALSRALRILEHQLDNPDHDQDDHGNWADGMGGERDGVVPGSRGMPGSVHMRDSGNGQAGGGPGVAARSGELPASLAALSGARAGIAAIRNEGTTPGVVIDGEMQDTATYEQLQAAAMQDPIYRRLAETFHAGLGKQAYTEEEWQEILTDERRSSMFLEAATLEGWQDPGGDLAARMESMIDWASERIAHRAVHLVSEETLGLIDSLYGPGAGVEFAEGAADWYEQQMRAKATEIADGSGGRLSFQQAIGLLAVTSPQTDWTGNMARAELLAQLHGEIWNHRPDWSQSDTEWMEYYNNNRIDGKLRSLTVYSASEKDEDGVEVPIESVRVALQDAIDNGLSVGELIERHGYAGSMIVAVSARLGSDAAWLGVERDESGNPYAASYPEEAYGQKSVGTGQMTHSERKRWLKASRKDIRGKQGYEPDRHAAHTTPWSEFERIASGSMRALGGTAHPAFRELSGLTAAGGTGGVPLIARALTIMGRPDLMTDNLAVKTGNFALNGALAHYIGNTNDVIHTSIIFGDTNRKTRAGKLAKAIYTDYGGTRVIGGRVTHPTYAIVSEATQRATRLINDGLGGNMYPNQPQALSWIDHRLFGQDSIGKRGMAWDEMHAFFEARGRKADKGAIDQRLHSMGLRAKPRPPKGASMGKKERVSLSEYLEMVRKLADKPGKRKMKPPRNLAIDTGDGRFITLGPGQVEQDIVRESVRETSGRIDHGMIDAIGAAVRGGEWIPDPEEEVDPEIAAQNAQAAAAELMRMGGSTLALLSLPGVVGYLESQPDRDAAKQALTEALRRRARRAKRG